MKRSKSEFIFLSKNDNVEYICNVCKSNSDFLAGQREILEHMVKKTEDILRNVDELVHKKLSSFFTNIEDMFFCFWKGIQETVKPVNSKQNTKN